MQFSDSFRAMDTDIDVIVEGEAMPPGLGESLRLLFEQQEERFSRFRGSSLLARLNRGEAIGEATFVAGCRMALEAHAMTGGLFNPMVLPALAEAGYDTTFGEVRRGAPREQEVPDPAGCLLFEGDKVRLAAGQLDLGGIVKGWTVDLAVERFGGLSRGMLLNAGGDVRCSGNEPGVDGWLMAIDDGRGGAAWEGALRGALTTSTTAKRRWRTDTGAEAHHLIDPRTGMPAAAAFVQVSTWAAEAWRAEVWAKAILVGGEAAGTLAARAGIRALALAETGEKRWFGA